MGRMTATLPLILMVFALVFFVLATVPVGTRINLVAAGLACLVLAMMVGGSLT